MCGQRLNLNLPFIFYRLLLVIVGASAISCDLSPRRQEEGELKDLYRRFMNAPLPPQATNFKGQALDNPITDLYSWGYFTYRLERAPLKELLRHQAFAQQSQWNRGFSEKIVQEAVKDLNLTYYNNLTGKTLQVKEAHLTAYEGVFFPYVHTIIYDTLTGNVQHFVGGMKD